MPHDPKVRLSILASGSRGNAAVLAYDRYSILIDAGLSMKATFQMMDKMGEIPADLEAILLTHEHNDHAVGAVAISDYLKVKLYSTRGTLLNLPGVTDICKRRLFEVENTFHLGPFRVERYEVPHDATEPSGFVFEINGHRFGWFCDLGTIVEVRDVAMAMSSCSVVFVDANHDVDLLACSDRYDPALKQRLFGPLGHLSNTQIARWAKDFMPTPRRLICGHLGPYNNRTLIMQEIGGALPKANINIVPQDDRLQINLF